ncbi:hypothetical protein [Hymenobacter lucidus]|uniref:Uncharacterized protein n=1 Tax=Hymenobacter lucidus TaxID=2880930 RepID=A0ABS8AQF3_9BACT|nr:hypothetical protein [Hymenobacter lucidus]MCB2408253.1 hypothetical protein [Hymenobacter lucidus]
MTEFLQKLKLVDYFTAELEIEQAEFAGKLQKSVDKADIGMFSGIADIFSASKNQFKGSVDGAGFRLKRKRKLFDTTRSLALAEGTFSQQDQLLVIATKVNGFSGMMIPYFIFLLIFYCLFVGGFFLMASSTGRQVALMLPFVALHAAIMFGIPYFMMRRSVKQMKANLVREFDDASRK